LLILLASPLAAGVVYEIEVTDHAAGEPSTTELAAEGKMLKMSIAPGRTSGRGEMIFRGDRREMVVVDHDDKSYVVMDEATAKQLADQLGGVSDQMKEAMKRVEEQLKNVPEDQRAMVEKMLKERMPNMGGNAPSRPANEYKRTGQRATKAGYPCVRYDVLRGGEKVREMWVTDWDNVEGAREVREAMLDMADFFEQIMSSLSESLGGLGPAFGGDSPFDGLREMDGFPVVVREFDGGELESESTLRSARRRTLDPADFEPPAGYKRRSMGPQ